MKFITYIAGFFLLFFCMTAKDLTGVYEVRQYNGTPTLFMEGKPYFGLSAIHGNIQRKLIRDFATADIHIYHLLTHFCDDPADIIQRMQTILKWDPAARFTIRISLMINTKMAKEKNPVAAKWFQENPPGEDGENQLSYLVLRSKLKDEPKLYSETPSVASQKWLDTALPIYKKFIRSLEESSCGKRIAMYMPSYQEGNYAYSFGGPVFFSDYNKHMKAKFRGYLKKLYAGDVKKLQTAWHNNTVTFGNAEPPSPKERLFSSELSLRNPQKHQNCIDFEMFLSEMITDHILAFVSATKTVTNRKKITGTFTGYLCGWLNSGGQWRKNGVTSYKQTQGFTAPLKYFDSPDLDYISSPHSYIYRAPGEPVSNQIPNSSWRLRNKLFIWEDDTRTSVMALFDEVGSCKNVVETIGVLKRNFGYNLSRGYLSWIPGHYFGYSACDDPDIMAMLKKFQEIGKKSLNFERNISADVAMIFDSASILRFGIQPQMCGPMMDEMEYALCKSGVGYDSLLLDDLGHKNTKDYKLYIFSNPLYLTEKQKKMIREKLARNKAVALWLYAPGYVTDNGYSLKSVADVTGIHVEMSPDMARTHLRFNDAVQNITSGMSGKTLFFDTDASKKAWGPQFYINDPEAIILGSVHENGKPGFAMKKLQNGTTSFYSTVPCVGWQIVRNIARYAGVHVWMESGDFIVPGKKFLTVHACSDGVKTIRLPAVADVYEIFDEKTIAVGKNEFRLNMKKGETALLYTGRKEKWIPGKKVVFQDSDRNMKELEQEKMIFYRKPKAEKCFPIDLSGVVKYYTTNPTAKKGIKSIPVGRQILANVPFNLLDPTKGPVCLLLRGKQFPWLPDTAPDVKVEKKASYLYFLHHAGWMNRDYDTVTMEYLINYEDGTQVRVPIRAHAEIADSVNGGNLKKTGLENPETKIAVIYSVSRRYSTSALYAYRWKNPCPNKKIVSIGFSSKCNTGKAIPAVFAITAELAD
ncbi:MAG: beta-galactosidase [Lentisphaeria bacterium]|nr:beta-galactosidase [Lentisphaeria bacterium]